MADVKTAAAVLEKYKKLIVSGQHEKAKALLTDLKLLVVQFPALPPACAQSSTGQQELMIARDMLEQSVLLAVKMQDDALFQRNFQQLQVYYSDLRSALPPSELEPTIIGMNLLRLLVANRIAELHVELEMLSPETQAHPSIAFPRQLEQALMEGTYRQVLAASSNSPSEYMQPLLQQLAATVRDELAACASAAYQKLLLKDAAQMLSFDKQGDLLEYCAGQGWKTDAQYVYFSAAAPPDTGKAHLDVFKNMLTYARELDRII